VRAWAAFTPALSVTHSAAEAAYAACGAMPFTFLY